MNTTPWLANSSKFGVLTGSFCVLKIEGGGDSLSVPDKCIIRVDRHTIPGDNADEILKDFDVLLKNMEFNCSYEIDLMKRKTPFLKPVLN